jgi:K+-sensing histidine kinase KdpD
MITDHPEWDDAFRAAWRLASAFHGELFALLPTSEPNEGVRRHHRLATDLGAEVVPIVTTMPATIAELRVTDVVVAAWPQRRWGRTTWPELDVVMDLPDHVDIHVVRIQVSPSRKQRR